MRGSTVADLIPLEIGVQCIFSAIYDDAPTHERLTGLAQAVVALVPVYVRRPEGTVSAIPESELREGLVRDAGALLQFGDGRPAVGELFISRAALEHTIRMLADPEAQTDSVT